MDKMESYLEEVMNFHQEGPQLGNQFLEDTALRNYLNVLLPKSVNEAIHEDLVQFGDKVADEYLEMAHDAEDNKPSIEKYDVYGKRIDRIHTSEGWRFFKPESAIEGLIAIPYENQYSHFSRIYQVVKLYLFSPSSGLYSCPLAMTDGAAFTLRALGRRKDFILTSELDDAYKHLTSRNPKEFWTSGQWMTEKKGGSDVSGGTATLAQENKEGSTTHNLYGYKWFTSATDADMSIALARSTVDGKPVLGGKGLGLYFIKLRDENGDLNNLEVVRLKDKLGTRQLPTGEMLLKGTKVQKIGGDGDGVRFISNMLNITRLHNSLSAVSNMRRIIALARDYSGKRETFGKKIKDHPLHYRTLASMEMSFRGNLIFMLNMALLLGKIDNQTESEEDKWMFRLMIPLLKLFTAKEAMRITSEGLECFGGFGYLENSYLPVILRDSQVLPIWEGTTNILSLDLLRAILKWPRSLDIFYDQMRGDLSTQDTNSITDKTHLELIGTMTRILDSWYKSTVEICRHKDYMEFFSRTLAFNMSLIYVCHKLLLIYTVTKEDKDFETLLFWVHRLEKEYEAPKEPRMLECFTAREKMMGLDLVDGKPSETHSVIRSKI